MQALALVGGIGYRLPMFKHKLVQSPPGMTATFCPTVHPGVIATFCPNCGSRCWSSGASPNTRVCSAMTVTDDRTRAEAAQYPGACGARWSVTSAHLRNERELLHRRLT